MMKFSKIFFFSIFIVTLIFSYICWNVPFGDIYDLPNHLVVDNTSTEDVADFGSLINANYNENTNTVDIMLLNTVKLNSVEAITKKQVYLGGQTVGFSYYGDGVLVVSNNGLDVSSQELEAGDIIKSINNTPITRVSKITEIPAKPKQITTMRSNFCFNIPILLMIKLPNKPPIEEKSSNPP